MPVEEIQVAGVVRLARGVDLLEVGLRAEAPRLRELDVAEQVELRLLAVPAPRRERQAPEVRVRDAVLALGLRRPRLRCCSVGRGC